MLMQINRTEQHDCITGVLTWGGFRCFTLELPWLDNNRNVSAIPAGRYECSKHYSPKNGTCITVHNVLMRDNIQIHVANYLSDILGCIAVGDSIRKRDNGELWVTNSTATLNELMVLLPENFLMEIK